MVEKAADGGLEIERYILVDDALAKALFRQLRRGHGARRQNDIDAVAQDRFDERRHRQGFADACRMDPDQRAVRTWMSGAAIAFTPPRAIFLALAGTPDDIGADYRIGE